MIGNRWTPSEIIILKRDYPEKGANIPELLKMRTKKAIKHKADRLKLKYKNYRRENNFTDKEIIILRKKYPRKGTKINELLKRHTRKSIQSKTQELKIKYEGKYDIKEEELRRLYVEEKMSSCKIAKVFGCRRGYIKRMLGKYDIPERAKREATILARGYLKRVEITNELRSIIDGITIGDGSILSKSGITGYISIGQRIDRRSWLEDLKNVLEDNGVECKKIYERDNGGEHYIKGRLVFVKRSCDLITRCYVEFADERKRWYPDGKKIIPRNIQLDDRVLAYWYMGDGSINKDTFTISFATHGFEKEDVKYLADILNKRFGYHPSIHIIRENQYKLELYRSKEITDFLKRTIKYRSGCFDYKWKPLKELSSKTDLNRRWTQEETTLLKECYPTHGANIPKINRTKVAIRAYANKLGIKYSKWLSPPNYSGNDKHNHPNNRNNQT